MLGRRRRKRNKKHERRQRPVPGLVRIAVGVLAAVGVPRQVFVHVVLPLVAQSELGDRPAELDVSALRKVAGLPDAGQAEGLGGQAARAFTVPLIFRLIIKEYNEQKNYSVFLG